MIASKIAPVALLSYLITTMACLAKDPEPIYVATGDEFYEACAEARGHSRGVLEIVLADRIFKTDKAIQLVAARGVRISAKKGATILCSDSSAQVMMIAYCDDIQISNLTLRHDPAPAKAGSLDDLIRIEHSKNVRLEKCNLELSIPKTSKPMQTTPELTEYLGAELLDVITEADKIISYRVNPTEKIEKEMVGGHAVIEKGAELSPALRKVLVSILLDPETYGDLDEEKRGFGSPEFGCRFIKGKDQVDVLVDFYRKELQFTHGETSRKGNCDSAVKSLGNIFAELFPKNVPHTHKKD